MSKELTALEHALDVLADPDGEVNRSVETLAADIVEGLAHEGYKIVFDDTAAT